jgi:chitinase
MLNNIRLKTLFTSFIIIALLVHLPAFSQSTQKPMAVIAYYVGDGSDIENYKTEQLTHIVFSFLHLKGNNLSVDNATDSIAITRLVALKQTNPKLKIILSLGGWGGCKTCSEVFNTETGRQQFAHSVLKLFKEYKVDGLDLDWEYPAIKSLPRHQYLPEDRANFTWLIQTLRDTIGPGYELSFAAGGFKEYLTQSIEWSKVMPLVNYVNVMTYDLVNGNSTRTGHLAPLFSTPEQSESTDQAIMFLDSIGVPMQKVVIGMAFYGRTFTGVNPVNNGLYQKGKFSAYINYRDFDKLFSPVAGYQQYWDNKAKAPYAYNAATKTLATFDNLRSVYEKTKYAKERNLGGVMFWELSSDKPSGGLLDMIYEGITK